MKTKEELIEHFADKSLYPIFVLSEHEDTVHKAMDEYAKQQVFAFIKFKEEYQREERRKVIEEQARVGGMFSWIGASDEKIYEQFIEKQSQNKGQ